MANEQTAKTCPHCGSADTYVMVKQTSNPAGWWLPVVLIIIGIAAAILLNIIGLVILVVCVIAAIVAFMMTRKGKTEETWRCNSCSKTFK